MTAPSKSTAINRRRLLVAVAASTATVATFAGDSKATVAAPTEPLVNPHLREAASELERICAERAANRDAIEWKVAEYKHLWPLAPEEILGGANADRYGGDIGKAAECDIGGRYIYREISPANARYTPRFHAKGAKSCFAVDRPEKIAELLADVLNRPIRARTESSIARRQKARADYAAQLRNQLRLAKQYFAETDRLRDESGIQTLLDRSTELWRRESEALVALMAEPAYSFADLTIKALAADGSRRFNDVVKVGDIFAAGGNLVADILAIGSAA